MAEGSANCREIVGLRSEGERCSAGDGWPRKLRPVARVKWNRGFQGSSRQVRVLGNPTVNRFGVSVGNLSTGLARGYLASR